MFGFQHLKKGVPFMTKTTFSLDEIKEKLAPIATKYSVNKILLFGSYSRGTADSESDLDFYIEDKEKLHSRFRKLKIHVL